MYPCKGMSFSLKNEDNSGTCNNMDESSGPCVKWNKPITERQIQWFHLDEGSRVSKLIGTEHRLEVPRGWGRRRTGRFLSDIYFRWWKSFGNSAHGSTTLWIDWMPQGCTLKNGQNAKLPYMNILWQSLKSYHYLMQLSSKNSGFCPCIWRLP